MSVDSATILTVLVIIAGAALAVAAGVYLYGRWSRTRPARLRVTDVYLSAEGSMLDVRYMVTTPGLLNAANTISVLGSDGAPVGETASAAKIGRLSTRRANARTGGYVLLRNRGNVAQGDEVTVLVGGGRPQKIRVR